MTKKMYARDALVSLAPKLPAKMVLDVNSESGKFTIDFLLRLDDEQLAHLCQEAKRKNDNSFSITFCQSQIGSDEPPKIINDFRKFNLNRVRRITFNGNTVPYLRYRDAPPEHYILAIFTME